MKKISVGVLGATGIVGQQYLQILADHPWFEVQFLAASERSIGKTYHEAVAGKWYLSTTLPKSIANLPLSAIENSAQAKKQCAFVFSALSNEAAQLYEERYAAAGLPVISNANYHRSCADVESWMAARVYCDQA
jgi:aspartate-semialdehyde dehydrogenase